MLTWLRQQAQRLKADTRALYLAARHPATPWYAKLVVALIVAYALSPIDLIPDFVPVLGLLDELLLLPLGIALAIRLIPPPVLEECREQVAQAGPKPVSLVAGAVIITLWAIAIALAIDWAYGRYIQGNAS